MARTIVPTITDNCEHCRSKVEIKATMRWHQCPVCGLYFKPCSACKLDKENCMCDCPLDLVLKPEIKLGKHLVDSLDVLDKNVIALNFDWEDYEDNFDAMSFKIQAEYRIAEDRFIYREIQYNRYLEKIGEIHTKDHLTKREEKMIEKRMRKIAENLSK